MYKVKLFNIPELKGISKKNIEEHLKLYEGYVSNTNKILESAKNVNDSYAKSEMVRRFSFEFNGMKNHELYFSQFEGGPKEPNLNHSLYSLMKETFGDLHSAKELFTNMAMTRGVGWAMMSLDSSSNKLIYHWVDEQHLGQLNGAKTILALDMWEHAFVFDYQPSGKAKYIVDFYSNLNWEIVEGRF